MAVDIEAYRPDRKDAIVALSLSAWAPVFAGLEPAVPGFAYEAFYPRGWRARQAVDIAAFLEAEGERALVAVRDGVVLGWLGLRLHPEDGMGEIYILAVDPHYQRLGVARALMEAAMARMRAAGMTIVMAETGDDPGHAPSRATYQQAGFVRWPVARYMRRL